MALNTLLKVIQADINSIQRHRGTIVECLKDPDVSIKRRAMELCFALVNRTNISEMIDELTQFLATCEPEFKADCSSNMFIAMEKYAPNKKWHVDQMTRVLKTAGNNCRDDIVSSFITLLSNTPELQFYTMNQLVQLIKDDVTQQPLVQVASWCLGEYGDQYSHAENTQVDRISEEEIANILIRVLNYNAGQISTRQYAINALIKLTTRFPNLVEYVQSIMSFYGCNMNLDLQQRAVEYYSVIKKYDNLREGLFEQMPALEIKTNYSNDQTDENALIANEDTQNEEDKKQEQERHKKEAAAKTLIDLFDDDQSEPSHSPVAATTTSSAPNKQNDFDILGIIDAPVAPVASVTVTNSTSNNLDSLFSLDSSTSAPVVPKNNLDILDLFGSTPSAPVVQKTTGLNSGLDDLLGLGSTGSNSLPKAPAVSNGNDILDIFSTPSTIASNNVAQKQQSMTVYEKYDLKIVLEPAADGRHSSPEQHFVQMKAHNLGITNSIKEFLFSAAVPKTMQMQLSQPSTSLIQPLDSLTQIIAISNPKKVSNFILLKF